MPRESDLVFGLLALQMNFVSKEHLLECAAVWMNDPKLDMGKLFLDRGHLTPKQHAAVAAMVEAHLDAHAGDPARSLSALKMDRDLRESLLALNVPPDLRQSLAWVQARGKGEVRAAEVTPAAEGRYRLGAELGRGGLGQVVEAFDGSLERQIAVKLALDGASAEVADRFVREAKLAGRLDHPNIVPVFDFGTLGNEKKQLFLAMKRVRGRDLGKVLASIGSGDAEARERWSRTRLLQVFQDICNGMAFAHDLGVIHRDLKPANVMLGDYGEVHIVDWGLARVLNEHEGDRRSAHSSSEPAAHAQLTLEGEVVGTPAYMPPEQAEGRLQEMDQRSDIYSLGAILYEILTLKPPFDGLTAGDIISQVRTGRIAPPSHNASVHRPKDDTVRTLRSLPSSSDAPPPLPPELDAICLKALAFRREDRFQSVKELQQEMQLFLDGVKERRRNHRLAEEAVARAKEAVALQARLLEEAKVAEEAAKQAAKGLELLADTSALWAAEDRAKQLARDAVNAFSEADAALSSALTHESGHREARRLRAELYWKRTMDAEAAGDEKEQQLNRAVVEQYNDGPLDALLRGDGTLTVRTRAYACRCLLDGRMLKPEELAWQGYHPFSGRPLDGHKGAEGLPELEPKEPLRLKVHASSCEPAAIGGADVWLFRYEEIGRRLIPVTPDLRGSAVSEGADGARVEAVDGIFDPASPYRPQGPGVWLGRTPLEKRSLPMGSYLLLVALEGRAPLRVPVTVPRCGHWEQEMTLFRPEEIPAGFVVMSAGPFGYQGDPENPYSGPAESKVVDDVFIARHPVTCREYCEFLNGLANSNPEQAARRVPRQAEEAGFYWPGPPYAVPTTAWLATAPVEPKAKARRLMTCSVDWEADWPVFGISWEDGMAYAAWRRAKDATFTMLPHEVEWEKSARGTDRRFFPWGRHWDDRWSNGSRSNHGGARPVRVEEFESDDSPYGVRGLGGNSKDACLNDPGPENPGWRLCRGGNWNHAGVHSRAAGRTGNTARDVYHTNGIRVACAVRLARRVD
ncbi:MAG: serine/threonine protein kinase-related [Planctomycetota bacterium]|nr:MAG: serine/threonine protein kinase-related [Planctomycetota bacterium]